MVTATGMGTVMVMVTGMAMVTATGMGTVMVMGTVMGTAISKDDRAAGRTQMIGCGETGFRSIRLAY
jgi:hypothetical protein